METNLLLPILRGLVTTPQTDEKRAILLELVHAPWTMYTQALAIKKLIKAIQQYDRIISSH